MLANKIFTFKMMPMNKKSFFWCTAAALCVAGHAAQAETSYDESELDAPLLEVEQEKFGWQNVTVGIAGGLLPEYMGADDSNAFALPYVTAKYQFDAHHGFSFSPYEGLSYKYTFDKTWAAGLTADWRGGRDSSDDASLSGMPDIDGTVELGPWVSYRKGLFSAKLQSGFDVLDEHGGAVLDASAGFFIPISKQWKANIGVNVLGVSDDFNETYFSVSSAQSTLSRPVYSASGGLAEAGATAGLLYMIDEHWFVWGNAGYSRLLGDAADSPLVQEENQLRGFLSIGYKF